ncbi:MAG: ribitol-5-phosphate dehydrogenase, partial [Clostridia bacterium]|nr:ribitol-5-phosphate dehydrogenase [Clostridia bacterium]
QGNRSREALKAKLPMALIHECVAKVVFDPTGNYKCGELVVPVPNTPTEEDEVIAENYLPSSRFCSSGYDGFLRDYIDMPPERLVRVPENVDPKVASFSELVSVAVHAVDRFEKFSHSRKNSIGIWGDGNVGFITALVLKALYPDAKLYIFGTVYEKLGYFSFAHAAYHVDSIPADLRVDHAFECVGGEASRFAIAQIIDHINPEGSIGLMGVSESFIGINTRMVLEKGLRLFGSSRSGVADFQKTMDLLAAHPEISAYLENIIGEVFDIRTISDIHSAFAHDISRHFGKTVLKWLK